MIHCHVLKNDCQTFTFAERHLGDINNLLGQLSSRAKPLNIGQFYDLLNEYPGAVIILAEDWNDDKFVNIVGMCMIFFQPRLEGPLAEIHSVVVDENYRGRRIGDLLTEAMLAEARCYVDSHDVPLTVYLTSKPAREAANHLYQKHGFALVAQATGEKGTNLYKLMIEL
jgi:ribosomal protein S18 acetylase RimI-like enzyme